MLAIVRFKGLVPNTRHFLSKLLTTFNRLIINALGTRFHFFLRTQKQPSVKNFVENVCLFSFLNLIDFSIFV